MNIIFDLDGTLIDSSERMFRLFSDLISENNLNKAAYWDLKRDRQDHKTIIERRFPHISYEDFNRKWMMLIESSTYLAMDENFSDTVEVLERLSQNYELYLLTARQSRSALLEELQRLKLTVYFKDIFTTENKLSKAELLTDCIRKYPDILKNNVLFVSDMGKDIAMANKFKLNTAAVTHGFMSKERLTEYAPQYFIEELSDLYQLLTALD